MSTQSSKAAGVQWARALAAWIQKINPEIEKASLSNFIWCCPYAYIHNSSCTSQNFSIYLSCTRTCTFPSFVFLVLPRLLSPLSITIIACFFDLRLLPGLVIPTLVLLLTPFSSSSSWFSHSTPTSHSSYCVSFFRINPAKFLTGHVASVANLLPSGSAAPKSWPSVSRWLKPGQQLLSDWQGS